VDDRNEAIDAVSVQLARVDQVPGQTLHGGATIRRRRGVGIPRRPGLGTGGRYQRCPTGGPREVTRAGDPCSRVDVALLASHARRVADVEAERGPVSVDQGEAAPGTQDSRHAINGDLRISEPLQCSLGPNGIEGFVRLVERQGVTDGEACRAPRGARSLPGDVQHLGALVDPDDLAGEPKVLSEVEGCVTEAAAHIEKAVTIDQTELLPLECSELSRCAPRRSRVHGAKQHREVLVAVDLLEPKGIRVPLDHAPTLRTTDVSSAPCRVRMVARCRAGVRGGPQPSSATLVLGHGAAAARGARMEDSVASSQSAAQARYSWRRRWSAAKMPNVDQVEVVLANNDRVTLRVGDVFLKIDADQTRTDVEVKAMAMAPVPTPEILWRKPPALALAALPGKALGRLEVPSTASPAAWAAAGAAIRTLHDAPLPPWPGKSVDELASRLACECDWLIANDVLSANVVTRNRRLAEEALRPWPPVFTHGDLHIAHVFIDGDEISGIIDWSEASQGDALFDLATLTLAHEEHLDDVLAGYGTDVDRDLIRAWRSWRCLVAVRWLFENGYGAPDKYPEVAVLRSHS
jgi:aminoglycoside phosphotransferase